MQVLFEYFDIKSEPKKYFYILYVIDSNSRGWDATDGLIFEAMRGTE